MSELDILIVCNENDGLDDILKTTNYYKANGYYLSKNIIDYTNGFEIDQWSKVVQEGSSKIYLISCKLIIPKKSTDRSMRLPFIWPRYKLYLQKKSDA